MNDREKFIIRASLIFMQSNIDDANESFDSYDCDCDEGGEHISVNGDCGKPIEEDELARILMVLQ
jgi:hypothetical protein